jgi:pantoate--beta-alanine ligase
MGALHAGHATLIRRCLRVCDRTVVSIFVNPAQFAPNEDFQAYPKPLRADLAICRQLGADLVFTPKPEAVYPSGFDTFVKVGALGQVWEGAARPGHFDGVATVVLKLLAMVTPDVAIFGQKDYQQFAVLKRMVSDFHLPVKLMLAPIARESDGLALSSRNVYLDNLSRQSATGIPRALRWAEMEIRRGEKKPRRLEDGMRTIIEEQGVFMMDYAGFCDLEALSPKRTVVPPLVILTAAICRTAGPAYNRRYIDNILVR